MLGQLFMALWALFLRLFGVVSTTLVLWGVTTQTLHYFAVPGVNPNYAFLALFAFRYLRLVVHCLAYLLYRPVPIPENPRYTSKDVTAVVPTVTPDTKDFLETITCICANQPRSIVVVTVGAQLVEVARQSLSTLMEMYPKIEWRILATDEANKRHQIAAAVPEIQTDITFQVDASAFWKPCFLKSALAPFEDPEVYLVGTNKRVRVTRNIDQGRLIPLGFIFNFFGSIYLERHNFEIRATNTMDSGLFAVSGRTMGIRTEFLQDQKVLHGFVNEKVSRVLGRSIPLFNAPLLPDDDNYLTRQVVNAGHRIKIQFTDDARVEIGAQFMYPRFFSQCLRWARSTFRSNCASLITERAVWGSQPWSVYAVYINGMVNFAVFCDGTLLYLLRQSDYRVLTPALVAWILVSKMIKLIPYFLVNPQDLVCFPVYVAFAYMHSAIKLWALLTFWSAEWSGRNLQAVNDKANESEAQIDPAAHQADSPLDSQV